MDFIILAIFALGMVVGCGLTLCLAALGGMRDPYDEDGQ